MTRKEQRIHDRTLELWYANEDWCRWKALSVAVREELQRQKQREAGRVTVRQVGLLEYWD